MGDEPAFVEEFAIIVDQFQPEKLANNLGPDVTTSVQLLKDAFIESKNFLSIAGRSKKPSQEKVTELAKNICDKIAEISKTEAKCRNTKVLKHLKSLVSISPALMWVAAPSRPVKFIEDYVDSAKYYTNQILKDFKDIGPEHREFVMGLLSIFDSLKSYVEDFHRSGLTWNPKGEDVSSASTNAPPGAPPSISQTTSTASNANSGGGAAALFASINKGGSVTSGLKKIDDSMKTHKNPALRASNVVKDSGETKTAAGVKKSNTTQNNTTKPPVFKLDNKKWIVEFQKDQQLSINEGGLAYTIYMYKCVGTTLIVTPKMNSITLEGCEKCNVILQAGIISSCDLINSKKCNIQCDDCVPTIALNGCDSANIYLAEKSLASDIVTSKSSSVNVMLMKPDGESTELYVPELFVSKIKDGKLITEPVVHE